MRLVAQYVALSLAIGFFFGFGWYAYLVNKLWGTTEYGGKRYVRACLKAMATSALLFIALFVARQANVSENSIATGLLVAVPFVLIGWLAHRWRYQRETE